MALDILSSGYATLDYEIAEERAAALGRLGARLEAALAALAAHPRTANSDPKIREDLVERAGYALWLFVVQREACGLRKIDHVIQVYGVPQEVVARMNPLAAPSIPSTKAMGAGAILPPMF
jgi:plasmid stabilization system protein ParE